MRILLLRYKTTYIFAYSYFILIYILSNVSAVFKSLLSASMQRRKLRRKARNGVS